MEYRISNENGFLRAQLLDRETPDETRKFLNAVVLASIDHPCSRVLMHVRLSKPLFTIERHGVLRILKKRSEERRVGKGVDLGGRRIIKKKKRLEKTGERER